MSVQRSSIAVACVLALVAAFFLFQHPVQAADSTVRVRWLLSHQPTDVFSNAVRVFANELSAATDGRMQLEVVMPADVGVTKGDIPNATVLRLLNSGDVQLATAYTVALGASDPELWSLNLPFAFDSYTSVSSFLDGPIGAQLLAGIGQSSSVRGLAFTMSGGFRIILTKDRALTSPADIKGLRIATSGGPVAEATLRALGATPVSLNLESGNAGIDSATIDGVETTYSRLSEVLSSQSPYLKYVNETNHNVFLTAILANKSFFDSLSPADQAALQKAAHDAAAVERKDSEALGEKVRTQLLSSGSTITALTLSERNALRKATASVYSEFEPTFGGQLTVAFRSVH